MRLTTTFLLAMLPLAAMACRDDQGATEPIPDGVRPLSRVTVAHARTFP
jgi:hypothetical protein